MSAISGGALEIPRSVNGEAGGPILSNEVTVRTWRTYAENLTEAGVSWKCDHVPNGMESRLNYFRAYHEAPTSSPLHQNIQQGPLDQFVQDAFNDRLPTVSWLFAPRHQNEHPAQSTPAAGAQFIASRIAAIAANPDVWAKTVSILVYDENDGFFDHVPPPTPPAGTPDEFVTLTSPTRDQRYRPADRRGVPRAVHHRLALDRRRLGVQRALRSYVEPPAA